MGAVKFVATAELSARDFAFSIWSALYTQRRKGNAGTWKQIFPRLFITSTFADVERKLRYASRDTAIRLGSLA
jgi:hypothetical protein